MNRLLRLAPAVLAGFLAEVLVPRAALIAHDHPGGAAPHVHLWVSGGEDHDHDHRAHRHRHAHPRRPRHDGEHASALVALRHVHVQQPYQRADRPAPLHLVRADRLLPTAVRVAPTPPAGTLPVARSRGPPRVVA